MGDLRVLVCGGRDYADRDHIWNTLVEIDAARGIAVVIHGAQTGADNEAMIWAQACGKKHVPYPPNFDDISHPDAVIRYHRNGRPYDAAAGPRRNKRMIDEGKPDFVIAFPGNKGTAGMVKIAKAAGLEVIEVPPLSNQDGR